jgi:hypothetical protein
MRSNSNKFQNFDYSQSSSSGVYFSEGSSGSGNSSYTPSFTMTPYSNNSNSGHMSTDETLQFYMNNPINPNCWRENIHAELETFAKNKLKQSGQLAPHNSPMKKSSSKFANRNVCSPKLNEYAFFSTPQGQHIAQTNQMLEMVDTNNGRCYGKMIGEARTFKEMWEIKGIGNCEILLKACGVQINEELVEGVTNLSAVAKLMFLFLVDKYPTANQDGQLYILHYIKSHQDKDRGDIYTGFKELDLDLYQRLPTKENCQNHVDDNLNTLHFNF